LGDSLLVFIPTNKELSCLDEKLMMYCQEIRKLENNFDGLDYLHILRGRNEVIDELGMLSSSWPMVPLAVFMKELHEASISRALSKANKVTK
jgi:hypothetical protein